MAVGGGLALPVGEQANRCSGRQNHNMPELSSLKCCTYVEDSIDWVNRTPWLQSLGDAELELKLSWAGCGPLVTDLALTSVSGLPSSPLL